MLVGAWRVSARATRFEWAVVFEAGDDPVAIRDRIFIRSSDDDSDDSSFGTLRSLHGILAAVRPGSVYTGDSGVQVVNAADVFVRADTTGNKNNTGWQRQFIGTRPVGVTGIRIALGYDDGSGSMPDPDPHALAPGVDEGRGKLR